ncbi:TetR/AcrR family transcriptional regulator [Streptomyces sp. SID8352]|uniref:TetR family transcriptional regulator n=1 Tax=Streptomyces sp. SID8352 TaxID=2690338 RepID=UPI0013699619|nr:TetR family transcriptional regulator [Streptomyces sp. SID8352]
MDDARRSGGTTVVRQERSERTRARLIRASSTVFDAVGYERAALTAISDLAEVSKGALSFHFAAKADLARAVQAEACAVSGARLAELARQEGPGLDLAIAMTHDLVRLMDTDVVVRAGARLAQEIDTPGDPSLHCHVNWLGALFQALHRARVDGTLTEDAEVGAATALLMSLVVSAAAMSRLPSGPPGEYGPLGGLRGGPQWLTRMLDLVRPTLAAT